MDFFTVFAQNWDFYLLLFLRVSGLIFSSPIFGRRNIPNVVKIGYCICISLLFLQSIPQMTRSSTFFCASRSCCSA
ncbi:flagellar biosynthetic protein FliR [Christensenella hongkongensis]|uniref:flagellar biosynthetic protein FliR n=1 Tax=Christensenella hongkongensis TaxID=270498 RepID=UPI0039B9CC76